MKIQEAAKSAGATAVFVRSIPDLLREAKNNPILVILDLNESSANALDAIGELKSDASTKNTKLLGFVSHVQTETIRAAREHGCDFVVPRSAFAKKMPEILSQLLPDD